MESNGLRKASSTKKENQNIAMDNDTSRNVQSKKAKVEDGRKLSSSSFDSQFVFGSATAAHSSPASRFTNLLTSPPIHDTASTAGLPNFAVPGATIPSAILTNNAYREGGFLNSAHKRKLSRSKQNSSGGGRHEGLESSTTTVRLPQNVLLLKPSDKTPRGTFATKPRTRSTVVRTNTATKDNSKTIRRKILKVSRANPISRPQCDVFTSSWGKIAAISGHKRGKNDDLTSENNYSETILSRGAQQEIPTAGCSWGEDSDSDVASSKGCNRSKAYKKNDSTSINFKQAFDSSEQDEGNCNDDTEDFQQYEHHQQGCFGFTIEESYQDVYLSPVPVQNSTHTKWKEVRDPGNASDVWFRGSLPSSFSWRSNKRILRGWRASERILRRWIRHNYFEKVEHLAFGTTETIREYDRDVPPLEVPIAVIGNILEKCNDRWKHKRDDSCELSTLKTFNLEHLVLVGRIDEFKYAFEQLSNCKFLLEFFFCNCRFKMLYDGDGGNDENDDNGNRFHRLQFKELITALNRIEHLKAIVIESCDLIPMDDAFADLVCRFCLWNKWRPPIRVHLQSFTLSDNLIDAMFGKDSRIERLYLKDCIYGSSVTSIARLLRTENRTMRLLGLTAYYYDIGLGIPEIQALLDALRSNSVLKHLNVTMNCNIDGDTPSTLNTTTVRSMNKAIANLAGLEILRVVFCPRVSLSSDHELTKRKTILRHVSSILRDGLGRNKTIKSINFMVGGSIHRNLDKDTKKVFKSWVLEEINSSLAHALSLTPVPSPSIDSLSNLNVSRGSVLQQFRFYVDGFFPVYPDPTTEFLLSLNRCGIQKLLRRPHEFELWRDAIIKHGKNSSIVYHLLRQNDGLLTNAARPATFDGLSAKFNHSLRLER